jgi:AcrR family transcriptional regulator
MVRKTKQSAEQTRNQILDAAERVFHAQGVSYTSLDDVAKAAGVTRGAIYWHFENKAALFNAMHERITLPFMNVFEPLLNSARPLQELQALCVNGLKELEINEQRRRVFDVLMHRCEYVDAIPCAAHRMSVWHETITQGVASVLRYAQSLGQLSKTIDPHLTAFGLHSYMHGLIGCRLSTVDSPSFQDSADVLVQRFFAGLSAESSAA